MNWPDSNVTSPTERRQQTFYDFLKGLKIVADQFFPDNASQFLRTLVIRYPFLFIQTQPDLMNRNKVETTPEEIKVFLHPRLFTIRLNTARPDEQEQIKNHARRDPGIRPLLTVVDHSHSCQCFSHFTNG